MFYTTEHLQEYHSLSLCSENYYEYETWNPRDALNTQFTYCNLKDEIHTVKTVFLYAISSV